MSLTDLRIPAHRDMLALLALNATARIETSDLEAPRLQALLDGAFRAWASEDTTGLLIALDQDAAYDSPNFLWFRSRYDRFVYVDRVIISAARRGGGIGRRLYGALFDAACAAGHMRIVCEVNSEPPNVASDAFHAALGFAEVGRASLANGKSVRYLLRVVT